jgi:hypothetical protein
MQAKMSINLLLDGNGGSRSVSESETQVTINLQSGKGSTAQSIICASRSDFT